MVLLIMFAFFIFQDLWDKAFSYDELAELRKKVVMIFKPFQSTFLALVWSSSKGGT
jgi:hypothetical protein